MRELTKVRRLWIRLSKATYDAVQEESSSDELAVDPWKSENRRIKSAWTALTDPENLEALVLWAEQPGMNDAAKAAANIALKQCKRRANSAL